MLINILAQIQAVDNLQQIGKETGFSLWQFLSQIFAVTILFIFLNHFAWKPVRSILEQRRKTIEESIANAEKIKSELVDAEAARIKVIQQANEKANAIVAEAEKGAVLRAEQKLQEASRQAEDIIRKAHEAAVLDRNRLMDELKRELGGLVVLTAEKVVGKVLTEEDHSRVNLETLRQLRANSN